MFSLHDCHIWHLLSNYQKTVYDIISKLISAYVRQRLTSGTYRILPIFVIYSSQYFLFYRRYQNYSDINWWMFWYFPLSRLKRSMITRRISVNDERYQQVFSHTYQRVQMYTICSSKYENKCNPRNDKCLLQSSCYSAKSKIDLLVVFICAF